MKDYEANSFDENYDDDAEGKLSGLEPVRYPLKSKT